MSVCVCERVVQQGEGPKSLDHWAKTHHSCSLQDDLRLCDSASLSQRNQE